MASKVGRPSKLRFLTPPDTEQSARLAGATTRQEQVRAGVSQDKHRHDKEPHFRHANKFGHMGMAVFSRAERQF
ncbi:hypothetical protein DFP74_4215 [Nocardiopsis sp. Huas11]|uniref:hypothetical protein n=1 Tax=Nocardiopsis sp. Huas11 TaxID=2183912 RepID=UPI000F22A879|nr:hypothetical protein [Nocardiopsis sp. Huas11]RKS08507.1 hypothetical protein DFP74_4215 [Nocardiopsis sp. Huas11]